MFGRKQSLVGLDIGSHTVKAVELEAQANRGYRLVNYGISAPLAEAIVDGEIMDRQLVTDTSSNLLESRGISVKNVVAAVSGRAVIVKKITMNRLSEEDAQQAIYWEAEQHVPYDINDVSLDFAILGPAPDPKQMQVLLVAAKKDMVTSFADLIREAGLDPTAIDVDSFAIQNALEANYDFRSDEVTAILNLGAEITNINIVQGGVPYFTKDLQVGGNGFVDAVQRRFNLSQSEAAAAVRGEAGAELEVAPVVEQACEPLATALERAQAYLRTTGEAGTVTRIMLCGGGSLTPGLADFLHRRFSVLAEIANPLARIGYDPSLFSGQDVNKVAPFLTVGIGLALRRLGDKR